MASSDSERHDRARGLRCAPTPAEQKLWFLLRDRRLGGWKFRRQRPIGRYFVDFCCRKARLIVEADGGGHNRPDQRQEDQSRTAYLESRGYRVLRLWNDQILEDADEVLAVILEELSAERG